MGIVIFHGRVKRISMLPPCLPQYFYCIPLTVPYNSHYGKHRTQRPSWNDASASEFQSRLAQRTHIFLTLSTWKWRRRISHWCKCSQSRQAVCQSLMSISMVLLLRGPDTISWRHGFMLRIVCTYPMVLVGVLVDPWTLRVYPVLCYTSVDNGCTALYNKAIMVLSSPRSSCAPSYPRRKDQNKGSETEK